MNEVCIRCLAQVELQKISWKFDEGRQINLRGPPVFVRLTLLGQTHTSPLLHPVFPLSLNYCPTFDRVFTNCKLQSLLPELLRDEQVKLELIQLKPDYSGGKILARYESSSYSFLFPDCNDQVVEMCKSRRYTYAPCVQLRTNVAVSNTIVKSPVSIIESCTTATSKSDPAQRLQSAITSTQHKLRAVEDTVHGCGLLTETLPTDSVCAGSNRDSACAGSNRGVQFVTSTPNNKKRSDIIDKYLTCQSPDKVSGNASPYQMVQDKVDQVLEHYWDNKVDGVELDTTDSEDEELIRNSFAAEREATLNQCSSNHSQSAQDSLITRLGPTDYWSRQLAEYSDTQSHRQVFSETMEKIYSRLYHRSKQ